MDREVKATSKKITFMVPLLFFFSALLIVSNVYLLLPITAHVADYFGTSIEKAAWGSGAFSLCYAFGLLFFGALSDRFNKKKIIWFGMGATAVITYLTGEAGNVYLFLLARGIQGFFAASFAPAANAYVFEVIPKQKQTMVLSLINIAFLLSGVFGQLVASWITVRYGWTTVFIPLAVCYVILFIAISFGIPSERATTQLRKSNSFKFVRKPIVLYCYGITFSLLFSFVGMYGSVGDHLVANFYLSPNGIILFRSIGIIGMAAALFTGTLLNRFGPYIVLTSSLIVAISGVIAMLFLYSFYLLAAASVIYVSGISVTIPSIVTLIGKHSPGERGKALSIYAFILLSGASTASVLAAMLSFQTLILVIIAMLSIAVILSCFVKNAAAAQ
ncbi:MFS transporter [Pseudalkalibacillus caeni]|uniref:MFS transporter n=1 Tax=Exobacillus caeni TaxID=2574798 RepID=A0A5R9F369_9BACL|nr:MFS transporter [Pseudalkalibacillus caeni]TLS38132.1 MFS transporter [Pseudalkalibacillus caeni]